MTDLHVHPVAVEIQAPKILNLHKEALRLAAQIANAENSPVFFGARCRSKIRLVKEGPYVAYRQKFMLVFATAVVSEERLFSKKFLKQQQLKRNPGVRPAELPYLMDDERLKGLARVILMESVAEIWHAPPMVVKWDYQVDANPNWNGEEENVWIAAQVLGEIMEAEEV